MLTSLLLAERNGFGRCKLPDFGRFVIGSGCKADMECRKQQTTSRKDRIEVLSDKYIKESFYEK
jgi:hypothetical protein